MVRKVTLKPFTRAANVSPTSLTIDGIESHFSKVFELRPLISTATRGKVNILPERTRPSVTLPGHYPIHDEKGFHFRLSGVPIRREGRRGRPPVVSLCRSWRK